MPARFPRRWMSGNCNKVLTYQQKSAKTAILACNNVVLSYFLYNGNWRHQKAIILRNIKTFIISFDVVFVFILFAFQRKKYEYKKILLAFSKVPMRHYRGIKSRNPSHTLSSQNLVWNCCSVSSEEVVSYFKTGSRHQVTKLLLFYEQMYKFSANNHK